MNGPIDIVYPDNQPVAKSDVRSDDKTGHRRTVADANAIRNIDFSGQFGGLYVLSLRAFYDLDTSDATSLDDGVVCIIDNAGNRFKQIAAALTGKRQQVRVATTANITIATALNNGDTIDGVTLATNDLVLVKNQTSNQENGIYVVGLTPARALAFDTYDEHAGAMIAVIEGDDGEGSVWFCTANAGGILETTAIDFTKVAAVAGPPGEQGPPGPATIAIGIVTTVAAGEDATVTNSGDDENVILDFEIPEGAQGDAGPPNELTIGTVEDGISADATITGAAPNQVLNLVLPKGDPGDDGAAATITIGTVTTVAPGDPATVTNVGTSGAAIFDFEIPQGDPGDDGAGTGDVVGPASATADHFASFDGATGKLITDSGSSANSFATAAQGAKADSAIQSVVEGDNITIDATDPQNPVISAIGGLDITSLSADPSPDSTADYIPTYDTSASSNKKVLPKDLRPDALSTASGSAPSFGARAWASFTGAGSAVIEASGNVASVVRNSTGNYTVTFTTAMPDVNYAILVSVGRGTAGTTGAVLVLAPEVTGKTTSSFTIRSANAGNSSATDIQWGSFAIFR